MDPYNGTITNVYSQNTIFRALHKTEYLPLPLKPDKLTGTTTQTNHTKSYRLYQLGGRCLFSFWKLFWTFGFYHYLLLPYFMLNKIETLVVEGLIGCYKFGPALFGHYRVYLSILIQQKLFWIKRFFRSNKFTVVPRFWVSYVFTSSPQLSWICDVGDSKIYILANGMNFPFSQQISSKVNKHSVFLLMSKQFYQ